MVLPVSISGWLPTVVAAVFLAFLIIGIAKMIARAFHLPYLDMWAKVESQEFVITLLIIGSLSSIVAIGDSVAQASSGSACPIGDCLINTAIGKVQQRTTNSAQAFLQLKDIYKKLGKWTNFYKSYMTGYIPIIIPLPFPISTPPPAIIFTRGEAPGQGMGLFFGPLANAANFITLTQAENIAFIQFLEFVRSVSFPLLLPLGILLRAFSLTRRAGSTLIAISFGLSMILPASVIIGHDQLYEPGKANIAVGSVPEPKLPPPYFCNFFFTWLWSEFGIGGFTIPGGLPQYIGQYCPAQCTQCTDTTLITGIDLLGGKCTTPKPCNYNLGGAVGDIPYYLVPECKGIGCCGGFPSTPPTTCDGCQPVTYATTAVIPRAPGVGCGAGPIYIPHPSPLVRILSLMVGQPVVGPEPGCLCCTRQHCWAWCTLNLEIWYHSVNGLWGVITSSIMRNFMNDPPEGEATAALYSAADGIAYNMMISTILIILSAFITASFIRSISEMIGGDTRLYGLYRLV
ncbi:hypothetical protein HY570_03230 [Candidatus Micrarchaeota archaeon]|nr:hypothetical protein [Candidatus Micrarchaeota archaeon]